ncbi:MAG: hypothetical protein PHX83_14375 [Acidobacteriia bacterium]|nr:hypothetical protein [Terriglobia bacterium]
MIGPLNNMEDNPTDSVGELLRDLPPIERITDYSSISCLYGAHWVAARYCGFERPPLKPQGLWQHGWRPDYFAKDPAIVFGGYGYYQDTKDTESFWVARIDQEQYLRQHGYRKARAIGLVVVYLPEISFPRMKDSLLVMPVHSSSSVKNIWSSEEYAESIDRIKDRFSTVVVCVHQSSLESDLWVDAFRRRGFPIVQGAGNDKNSYNRLQLLMSRFEYVTSNGFGSHLAYASFFGAKVSIFGTYAALQKDQASNALVYREYPKILEPVLRLISEPVVREHYPELFCHPAEAKQDREWGMYEVGYANKVTPREMKHLFGWDLRGLARRKTEGMIAKGKAAARKHASHLAKMIIRPEYRSYHHQFGEMLKLPPDSKGNVILFGRAFEFCSAGEFLLDYQRVFQDKIYRFCTPDDAPLIIDGRPGAGLTILYFKQIYPDARILAFEPGANRFAALKKNSHSYGWSDTHLYREDLGSRVDTMCTSQGGHEDGHVLGKAFEEANEAPTRRLRDLMEEKVTMLRLVLPGREVCVLEDCSEKLANVENMFIEYHSFFDRPQDLHQLLSLLYGAGFRIHIHNQNASPQPLFIREFLDGTAGLRNCDMKLGMFCFRD